MGVGEGEGRGGEGRERKRCEKATRKQKIVIVSKPCVDHIFSYIYTHCIIIIVIAVR